MNGDLGKRAYADTDRIDWAESPSGTVWRKRVHLVGPPESGQVTSIVRYEPESSFPPHDHPDGEEILVLDGVFSDEHGDWPKGSYLLNPAGFRHAPFSKEGCLLFVKLRQYPGTDRDHVVAQTADIHWESGDVAGVLVKPLYRQDGFSDEMRLERWDQLTDVGETSYPQGAEFFVIDGEFSDDDGDYGAGSWLRLPEGSSHHPRTGSGCLLYIKTGGLPYLRDGV